MSPTASCFSIQQAVPYYLLEGSRQWTCFNEERAAHGGLSRSSVSCRQ